MFSNFYNTISLIISPTHTGYPLFVSLLFIISKTTWKDKLDVKEALEIANILNLISSLFFLIYFFGELFTAWYSGNMYESYAFSSRIEMSYKTFFLLIFLSQFISIIFFFKYCRRSFVISLIVAILTFVFMYRERIISFIVSLQRDFLPSKWVYNQTIQERIFLHPITQTILLSIVVAIIYRIKKRN